MEAWIDALIAALELPKVGLVTLFVVSVLSATLLPLGSEPVLFGLIKLDSKLFWPAIGVATAGNTVGGIVSWWMGYGAERAFERVKHRKPHELRALAWLERFGPKACLLSWLPVIGDPLCVLAGWLKLPFWPCTLYMAIGKFLRYLIYTLILLWFFPGQMPFKVHGAG